MHKLVCDVGRLPASRNCQVTLVCDLEGVAACPTKMMCLQSSLNGHVEVTRRHREGDMHQEAME
jgi:hypothetical protein